MPAKAQVTAENQEYAYREFEGAKQKYPRDHYGMPKTDTHHIEIFLYLIECTPWIDSLYKS